MVVFIRVLALKPGDILRDKFRLDALIGRGGMGQVFAATALDSPIQEQVAIKVVSRVVVDDVLMVRLHREAEAAQRIRSDFVPRVLEVSDTDDGETFLVMERLVGESLSARIRDHGVLPWSEVARIGEDVLRGLIDAHTAGIVHRDLKPSNVFLALKSGRVRAMVLDFGVCKMDGLDTERLTGTGESIGTVAYMAPEQIRGAARVDERADLYAFGVVVFEMLSGCLPHDGPSQMAILASKLEKRATRLSDRSRVAIPAGADELIARTLARDPAERFANAQELLKAWRALSKPENLALGSAPPARMGRPMDAVRSREDFPTQVARPTPRLIAASMAETVIEQAQPEEPHPSRSFLPSELHPTQTSLTTHHTSIRRAGGGVRVALVLAACGLVVGVVVVGASFTRGDPSARTTTPRSATAATTQAATDNAVNAELGAPTSADASASIQVPLEGATTASTKPRHLRARPRPPSATAAPKMSGPHITAQPRY